MKGFYVLVAVLAGLLVCVLLDESSYEDANITLSAPLDSDDYPSRYSVLFIFKFDDEVDSLKIESVEYNTSCVAGNIEENASWTMSGDKFEPYSHNVLYSVANGGYTMGEEFEVDLSTYWSLKDFCPVGHGEMIFKASAHTRDGWKEIKFKPRLPLKVMPA